MPMETRSQRQAYALRPAYPQTMTSQTSTSSSAFRSADSLSSLSASSTSSQQSSLALQQQYSSAPLPSPSTGHPAAHYFGSSSQQIHPAQPQQQRIPSNPPPPTGTSGYSSQKAAQGATAETMPFLKDFSLVAEAAKRAQVACLVRDLDDVGL